MKPAIPALLFIFLSFNFAHAQYFSMTNDSLESIIELEDGSYEIKEYTPDSLLIYSGHLASVYPKTRQGDFLFYNKAGDVVVKGSYNMDVPDGKWEYYDDQGNMIRTLDYNAVWDYLDDEAPGLATDRDALRSLKKKDKENMAPDGTFYKAEQMPTFNGGDPAEEFATYVQENMLYPVYTEQLGLTGTVIIDFIIDDRGRIRTPVVVKSDISDLAIEAMRILSESPVWDPALQAGVPVFVRYHWQFIFARDMVTMLTPPLYTPTVIKTDTIRIPAGEAYDKDQVFYIVENMPEFNGGDPAVEFRKFIAMNLQYPEKAAENGIDGRVIVQFVVNETGDVVYPTIVRSVDPALDREAIRVVSISPKWTPGRQRGKAVKVAYTFPINFTLSVQNY